MGIFSGRSSGKTIFIAGLCLIIIASLEFTAGPGRSAKPGHLINDSALVARLTTELQRAEASGDIVDDLLDTSTVDTSLAGILSRAGITVGLRQIYYSPDSTFRILLFETEYCGGIYCHSQWTSYVYSNIANREIKSRNEFHTITNMYKMPDGKYLALQEYGARAFSACGESTNSALLFRIVADSMVIYPPVVPSGRNTYELSFISSSIQQEMEVSPYLNYDTVSKRLSYHHGEPCMYQYDSLGVYTGYYEYKKENFILGKETATYTKP